MTEYIQDANNQNSRIFTRWTGFNEVTGEVRGHWRSEIQYYEWSYGTGKDGIDLHVPWIAINKTNNNVSCKFIIYIHF